MIASDFEMECYFSPISSVILNYNFVLHLQIGNFNVKLVTILKNYNISSNFLKIL